MVRRGRSEVHMAKATRTWLGASQSLCSLIECNTFSVPKFAFKTGNYTASLAANFNRIKTNSRPGPGEIMQ
jgi:hypothetical protein